MSKGFPNIYVSEMSESDVVDVKELEIQSGLSSWSLENYKKEIRRDASVCFSAKDGGNNLVGFAISRAILIDPAGGDRDDSRFAEIYNICVLESVRREGIGRKLMGNLIQRFSESDIFAIWLEVRESNIAAIRFYERTGFTKTQTRANFYSRPTENGVCMMLNSSFQK